MKQISRLVILLCAVGASLQQSKKNIVVIMADDLGFNDVSFRGSNEIPTPNIDALAYNGAILNRFYTPPLCTPSRSSLMTAKYPYRLGMQHYVIPSDEPWGLGLDEKIMPQYFKDAGYATALVGKWHLGFYQQQYTPTRRGFDSFAGYLGPYIDYFDRSLFMFDRNYSRGYDFRRGQESSDAADKTYVTDLFTNEATKTIQNHDKSKPLFLLVNHLAPHAGNEDFPMQAPASEIAKFSYISNVERRTLAAMISILDQSVGAITKALADNKMLDDTVLVFYSDNGGPTIGMHSTNASNYPLRGQKHSGWEGAIRTNAIVYAPFLKNHGVVRNQLMHVSDFLPTLMNVAGVKLDKNTKRDGLDQWNVISSGGASVRDEVANIDDVLGFGSLIKKFGAFTFKLVNGTLGSAFDGWLASKNSNGNVEPKVYAENVLNSVAAKAIASVQKSDLLTANKILAMRSLATVRCSNSVFKSTCDLSKGPCLFNIIDDPCEENNLADFLLMKPIFRRMLREYDTIKANVIPTRRKPSDPACDPKNFQGNWQWWQLDS